LVDLCRVVQENEVLEKKQKKEGKGKGLGT